MTTRLFRRVRDYMLKRRAKGWEEEQLRRRAIVSAQFPGWERTVRTAEFALWLDRQSSETRGLAFSQNPDDAKKMLGMYHSARSSSWRRA